MARSRSRTRTSESGDQPRRFSSRLDAGAWALENFTNWLQSLTVSERLALEDYKKGAFTFVNDFLRGTTDDPLDRARAEELIPSIDQALARQRLPHAVVVYRHFSLEGFPARLDRLVGQVVGDKGYASTSLLEVFPLQLARAKGGVVAEIRVSRGCFATYLDLIRDRKEYELLLPRGLQIKVNSVELDEAIPRLTAKVIP